MRSQSENHSLKIEDSLMMDIFLSRTKKSQALSYVRNIVQWKLHQGKVWHPETMMMSVSM
jgi:hypothetical protein